MDIKDITTRVTDIIVNKLGVNASEVTPEAHLTKDLEADSLDTVEIILAIEQDFSDFEVKIDEADQPKVQTVGDIINYLNDKINNK